LLASFDWLLPGFDWLLPSFDWLLPGFDWLLPGFDWLLAGFDWLLAGFDWLLAGFDWLLPSFDRLIPLRSCIQLSTNRCRRRTLIPFLLGNEVSHFLAALIFRSLNVVRSALLVCKGRLRRSAILSGFGHNLPCQLLTIRSLERSGAVIKTLIGEILRLSVIASDLVRATLGHCLQGCVAKSFLRSLKAGLIANLLWGRLVSRV
jgi:hypothetical protein